MKDGKSFNCGGYALGTHDWYEFPVDWNYYSYRTDRQNRKKIRKLANMLCAEFSDLRILPSLKDLKEDEYAIALRITKSWEENDFHFIKRTRNGEWYEKMGSRPFAQHIPQEEVFADNWHEKYFGQIALFAKKVAQNA